MRNTSKMIKKRKGESIVQFLIVTAVVATLAIAALTTLASTLMTKNNQIINKIDNGITNSIN